MTDPTREALVEQLESALAGMEALTRAKDPPDRRVTTLWFRYGELVIKALSSLYPRPTVLQVEKPGQDWDALSPAERLALVEQARARLGVIETETKALTEGTKK